MSQGWVYIFSNPGLPKIVKVGFTLKHPRDRAKELSHSGVPRPYVIEYAVRVDDPHQLEKRVHQYLTNEGLVDGKEWFRCSADHAIAVLKAHSEQIHQELTTRGAGNTQAIAAEEQVVRDRIREREEEKKRKRQVQEEEIRVRSIERTITDVYLAVHKRERNDWLAVYETHKAIRERHTPKPSWSLCYLTVCLVGGPVLWTLFDDPWAMGLLVFPFGPPLTGLLYDHRVTRLKATFETSALSDQLRVSEERDLAEQGKRFPDMSDPVRLYLSHKVQADQDPPFLRPFPLADVDRLSLRLTRHDDRLDGELKNETEGQVVTCVEVGVSGSNPVTIPVVCFPGETKPIPTLSWRYQLDQWTWRIQRAWGYELESGAR